MSAENSDRTSAPEVVATDLPISCRAAAARLDAAPDWLMYMPGGRHTIDAHQGDSPVTVTVDVNRDTAATLERTVREYAASTRQRPFLDFDHSGQAASAWVLGFEWRESPRPGVFAQIEWSEAGQSAITGKAYRAFSPKFYATGSPARITGAPLNMGGLVNDPAFTDIEPLWAARSGGHTQPPAANPKPNSMTEPNPAAGQAAPPATTTDNTAALEARHREKVAALEAKLSAANDRLALAAKREAKAAINAAIDRGALAPQDTASHAEWEEMILANPKAADMLAKLPGNPALSASRVVKPGVEVTSEDPSNLFAAFKSERDPRKRGEIYHKAIKPIFTKKEDWSLAAANSLGTSAGSLIAQRTLDLLDEMFPWLKAVTTDFSDERAKLNQTIYTRIVTVPNVQDYSTSTGYAATTATTTDAPVVISKHRYSAAEFLESELGATNRNLIEEQAMAQMAAIGKDIADTLGATITASAFTYVTGISIASFARTGVVDLVAALKGRKVSGDLSLVLNPSYFAALAKDTSIVSVALPQSFQAMTTNQLPPIHGCKVFEWIDLPANSENLGGFALRRDALMIATRVPSDYADVPGIPSTALQQVVTNPHTGFSVLLTRYVDHLYGKAVTRISIMYGIGKGNLNSLQRLRTGP